MKFDIDKMTLKQLESLSVKIDQAKIEAKAQQRKTVIAKAEKLAADAGLTLSDVFARSANKRRPQPDGRSVPRLKIIRHPTDKSLSYRGRGRKPQWLKDIESSATT